VDPDGGHLDQNRAATDLFSARASQADYVYGNPVKLNVGAVKKLVDGAELVVFRFLGGEEQLPKTFTTCVESGLPLVVLGGQHTPDAALMELSTVPMGVAAQARSYFVQGGLDNLRTVHAFLADTVLLTGDAFEPVSMMPVWSELPRPDAPTDEPAGHRRPRIGVILQGDRQRVLEVLCGFGQVTLDLLGHGEGLMGVRVGGRTVVEGLGNGLDDLATENVEVDGVGEDTHDVTGALRPGDGAIIDRRRGAAPDELLAAMNRMGEEA